MPMQCYLTVDLEDYKYNVTTFMGIDPLSDPGQPPRGVENIISVLSKVPGSRKITFFTTGQVARENPELISKLSQDGHEIACHTDRHKYISEFKNKEEFKEDLLKAKRVLEDCAGQKIIGFRAPRFSIDDKKYGWVYNALSESGFIYDSSISINKKRNINSEYDTIKTEKGIIYRFPHIIGGTWFRILPVFFIKRLMKEAFDKGHIPVIYLHPSDIDHKVSPVSASEMKEVSFMRRVKWKIWQMRLMWNRKNTAKKLESILKEFPNRGALAEFLPKEKI